VAEINAINTSHSWRTAQFCMHYKLFVNQSVMLASSCQDAVVRLLCPPYSALDWECMTEVCKK